MPRAARYADCVTYYEPLMERRCLNFMLILPSMGVFTVEVTDWRAQNSPPGVACETVSKHAPMLSWCPALTRYESG